MNIQEILTKYKTPAIIAAVVLFLFGTRAGKRLFAPRRRRIRRVSRPVVKIRTRTGARRAVTRTKGAVSRLTSRGRGYPAAGGGTIPFKYNKNGTIKKAQFVAGTLAAKRRMSQLRKNR